jgi:hypothetical protein
MARIAAATGHRKRLVGGAAVLSYGIACLMARKAGVTTGKTRVTNRKTAAI